MSGYDDFVRTVRDQPENESPQFMMDPWHSMPMDTSYDPMRIDPALMMTMGMDMSPLFGDVVACMAIQVLEIKKMVSVKGCSRLMRGGRFDY